MIQTYSNAPDYWGFIHSFRKKYTNKQGIGKRNYMIWIPIPKQFFILYFLKEPHN